MTLTFGGDYPVMVRTRTGLTSLDVAVAGNVSRFGVDALGLPMRTIIYVYSKHTGIGKSALVFSLAARLSKLCKNKNVAIMPTDTFALDVAQSIFQENGADGYVEFIQELEHDDGIARLIDFLRDSNTVSVVLDSLAAFESTSVRESDSVEDSNMGKNPFAISQTISRMNGVLKSGKAEKIAFITSALRQSFDKYATHKWFPKGGQAPYERSALHFDLNWTRVPNLIVFPKGRLISGEVAKNNFGQTGKVFRLFTTGTGIHAGMTAAYDCVLFGLGTGGKTVTDNFTLDGVKCGSPRSLMELPETHEAFAPFYNALERNLDGILSQTVTKKSVAQKNAKGKDMDDVALSANEAMSETDEDE